MISPWIEITEINGSHWVNFWKEMGQLLASGSGRRRPWLVLFHEEGRVIRAQLGDQSLPAGFPYPGAKGLKELGQRHGAGRVVGLETGALPRLWTEIEGRFRYGDDLMSYAGQVVRALRKASSFGIDVSPALRLPPVVPPRVVLDQITNLILPNGYSLALYVVEDGEIFTSLLLRKHRNTVTHLTTDDGLEDMGLDARRWREDAPRVSAEIARRLGPLFAAVYCERRALAAMFRGELTARQAMDQGLLICDPWPARWSHVAKVWNWAKSKAR